MAPKTNQNISCVAFFSAWHLEGLGEDCPLLFASGLDQLTEVGDGFPKGRDAFLYQLSLDLAVRHGLGDDVPAVGVVLAGVVEHRAGDDAGLIGGALAVALGEACERAEDEAVVGLDVRELFGELGEDFFGLEAGWVAAAEEDLDCCCWRGDMCVAHENIIARVRLRSSGNRHRLQRCQRSASR